MTDTIRLQDQGFVAREADRSDDYYHLPGANLVFYAPPEPVQPRFLRPAPHPLVRRRSRWAALLFLAMALACGCILFYFVAS